MPVTGNKDAGFTFVCEEDNCGFISRGWSTKEQAATRGNEHDAEHESEEAMAEIKDSEAVL